VSVSGYRLDPSCRVTSSTSSVPSCIAWCTCLVLQQYLVHKRSLPCLGAASLEPILVHVCSPNPKSCGRTSTGPFVHIVSLDSYRGGGTAWTREDGAGCTPRSGWPGRRQGSTVDGGTADQDSGADEGAQCGHLRYVATAGKAKSKTHSPAGQASDRREVVPSEDSHASEYIASCDARRQYISGFTGSAGCAVITQDKAILATDGRYFNQATKELGGGWELLKQGTQDVPTWQEWSATEAAGGKTVAVDPAVIAAPAAKKLAEKIQKVGGADLVPLKENLVDLCWAADRPPPPSNTVAPLAHEFCGRDTMAKLGELRQELAKKKASAFVVSMLDEIAWLFNLRGSDIPFNPVFFSYAVVTQDSAVLYTDEARLSEATENYLEANDVVVKPYHSILDDAQEIGNRAQIAAKTQSGTVPLPLISTKASWALKLALGGEGKVDEVRSPIGDAKAVKNSTEMDGMRACHIRDGAALIEFFAWLEDQLVVKKAVLDEVEVADKLEEMRRRRKHFVGLSFPTISSTGPNAAIIHYSPKRGECAVINPDAIYLCDSGAQYLDGTTDTTRTVHFGTPTDFEKLAYTLVLKGNIALDMAVFPKGTTGFALDGMARQYLWVGCRQPAPLFRS
jgi:Xaa-Pro aminopeptidase